MHYCSDCKTDVAASVTIDRSGAVLVCPNCGHGLEAEPASVVPAAIAEVELAAPKTTYAGKIAAYTKTAEPLDVIRAIRVRRRWLRGEIRRLRGLECEERELAAAEHAIEQKRRADKVTPIRKGAS